MKLPLNERPDWKWPKISQRGYKSVIISQDEDIVRLASSSFKKVVGSDPEMAFLMYWTETDFLVNERVFQESSLVPASRGRPIRLMNPLLFLNLKEQRKIYLGMMMG